MNRDLGEELHDLGELRPPLAPDVVARAAASGRSRVRRRRLLVVGGTAVAVAVVAVGGAALTGAGPSREVGVPVATTGASGPDLPVVVVDGEPVVSCGDGEGWPVSVMPDGVPDVLDEAAARETFQQILDDPAIGPEAELSFLVDGVGTEYRVLRADDAALTLGLGSWSVDGPARGALVMDLVREGDRWVFAGGGSCALLGPVLRDDVGWTRLSRPRVDPADPRRVTLAVNELQCTSARDPAPYLLDPVVVESVESVTVYWTTTPMVGGADCPGNPSVDREIVLDAPLGTRVVLDGSTWPPRPLGQPAD